MFLERWGLQQWLSPSARMVVRTMERRPLRTGLTIFGIAAAMAIVITGALWRDAIGELFDNQFQQVWRGDVSLSLIEVSPARVLHELARLPHVTAVEGTRSVAVKLLNANHQ
jgi:putative ABC transport system permease protein